jgi:hypothetical protein
MKLVVSKHIRVYKRYALFDRGRIVICRSGNLISTPSQSCRHWPYLVPKLDMSSTPIDVLKLIPDHIDKEAPPPSIGSTKPAILYRRISYYCDLRIGRLHWGSEAQVYQMLAQSTHLARRVRSFNIRRNSDDPNIHGALQNMINLRRLSLCHYYNFNLLVGCTFTLVSFTCRSILEFQLLHQFLLTQPSLTSFSLEIYSNIDVLMPRFPSSHNSFPIDP